MSLNVLYGSVDLFFLFSYYILSILRAKNCRFLIFVFPGISGVPGNKHAIENTEQMFAEWINKGYLHFQFF